MLIDWFTVAAQASNFLVLVWLLKRFLYRPVLEAIDARDKKVTATRAEAVAREAQAQGERAEFQRRSEALDAQREDVLRKAAAEAAVERQRLIQSARQESQALRSKLAQAMADERAELNQQLVTQTQAEVLAVARGALNDLAGVELEERMTDVFMGRLRDLQLERRHLSSATSAAVVRSAFEIAPSRRPGIEAAIRKSLGAEVSVDFETVPDLVCGIELSVDGVKLAWSVADYLGSIAANVAALGATTQTAASASTARENPPVTESQHGG